MTAMQRIRRWIEDLLCGWMFHRNRDATIVLMNIGRKYSERIDEESVLCSHCFSTWYPRVIGSSFNGSPARFCPYCGYHR